MINCYLPSNSIIMTTNDPPGTMNHTMVFPTILKNTMTWHEIQCLQLRQIISKASKLF